MPVQLLLDYRCWIDSVDSDGRGGPAGSRGGAMGTRYPPEVQSCLKKISDMTPQQVRGTGRATVWDLKLDSNLRARRPILKGPRQVLDGPGLPGLCGPRRRWGLSVPHSAPYVATSPCIALEPGWAETWTNSRPQPLRVWLSSGHHMLRHAMTCSRYTTLRTRAAWHVAW